MQNIAKTIILALALSTTMVLADDKTASMLDMNKVLPKTITIVEKPINPQSKKPKTPTYSPQQKAQIVGLELKAN